MPLAWRVSPPGTLCLVGEQGSVCPGRGSILGRGSVLVCMCDGVPMPYFRNEFAGAALSQREPGHLAPTFSPRNRRRGDMPPTTCPGSSLVLWADACGD